MAALGGEQGPGNADFGVAISHLLQVIIRDAVRPLIEEVLRSQVQRTAAELREQLEQQQRTAAIPAQLGEWMQRVEARMAELEEETRSARDDRAEAVEPGKLEQLEGRMWAMEDFVQKALEKVMPRVDALLTQLEKPSSAEALEDLPSTSCGSAPFPVIHSVCSLSVDDSTFCLPVVASTFSLPDVASASTDASASPDAVASTCNARPVAVASTCNARPVAVASTCNARPVAVASTCNVRQVAVASTGNVRKVAVASTGNVRKVAVASTGNVRKVAVASTSSARPVAVASTSNAPPAAVASTSNASPAADASGVEAATPRVGAAVGRQRAKQPQQRLVATRRMMRACAFRDTGEELCSAAFDGRLEDLRRLLDSGVAVNYRNRFGKSPLLLACRHTGGINPDVVSLLLERGANVKAREGTGDTALHWAASFDKSARCVALLLDAGADPNARGHDGRTPLHSAASYNNKRAVRALMRAGAIETLKCFRGKWKNKTPLDIATSCAVRKLLDPTS